MYIRLRSPTRGGQRWAWHESNIRTGAALIIVTIAYYKHVTHESATTAVQCIISNEHTILSRLLFLQNCELQSNYRESYFADYLVNSASTLNVATEGQSVTRVRDKKTCTQRRLGQAEIATSPPPNPPLNHHYLHPSLCHSHLWIMLHADDMFIVKVHEDILTNIFTCVLMDWCNHGWLLLNIPKCKSISVGTSILLNTIDLNSISLLWLTGVK